MAGESAPAPKEQSVFGDRFRIDMNAPLPQFDTGGGRAYKVVDTKKPDIPLYAFIQTVGTIVRHSVYSSLSKKASPNVVCPVARGLMNVVMGGHKCQRLVTIFERPLGEPLFTAQGVSERLDTSKLRTTVALSIIKAIAGLHKRGIVHANIRPDRMFFVSDESDDVYLGECLTTAPGLDQPHEMEPLNMAFADPAGRGKGTPERDFFQFGASIMALHFKEALHGKRDQRAMLMARVNQSSFWALAGGQDVPGALGQLLKGVMLDDEEDRWGFEDVLNWYEGSVPVKRSGMRHWTMSRPTNFKGTSYVDRRLLASALASDPKSAAVLIRGLNFEQWMATCMRDEIYSDGLRSALAINKGAGMGHEENSSMVSRFCTFLHPTGPIHYKGLSFYPEAFSDYLAHMVQKDERDNIRILTEVLSKKFTTSLSSLSNEKNPDAARALRGLSAQELYARSPDVGKGFERILYDTNRGMPCLSSKLENTWTVSIKQLLEGIDRLAEQGSVKNILLDRHIAAYILTHGDGIEREFNKLLSAKNDVSRFNTISTEIFAMLQRLYNVDPLPSLSTRLVDGMGNAIKSLKNRRTRDTVTHLLEKVKSNGDLNKLVATVNFTQIATEDARKFAAARATIMRLDREKNKLTGVITPNDAGAQQMGYKGSRNFAWLSLMITIIALVL